VERVVLAFVRHVGTRREPLAGVDQPDHVGVRARNGAPAQQARIGRGDRRGDCRPAHVEAERLAPGGHALAGYSPNVRVERVRVAGHPGQRDRNGNGRTFQAFCRPDKAALREVIAGGELESVRERAGNGIPCEGRGAGKGVDDRLVRAKRERVEALRAGAGRHCRPGRDSNRERGNENSS